MSDKKQSETVTVHREYKSRKKYLCCSKNTVPSFLGTVFLEHILITTQMFSLWIICVISLRNNEGEKTIIIVLSCVSRNNEMAEISHIESIQLYTTPPATPNPCHTTRRCHCVDTAFQIYSERREIARKIFYFLERR